MVIEVGRLCVKLAGRDAGKECLIVDVIDANYVMIDGSTRRRKCNIDHLELLPKVAKIKKGAASADVAKALKDLGFEVKETRAKVAKKKAAPAKKTIKEKVAAKVKSTKSDTKKK
ncbi:50S ribosomal protein L14e [Candidatus Woesearchaeota archaeon]|jgi:large subunit ribosomal protein L14e|nr:50S ribosomal protein L14e [Candidatus Woesearchaeota archaeon]MBT7062926.1 50S ribosomal protein L14e [Candidatus Woesearchaeota archaeon]MBT7402634.1 50S ribosomal protein L14e [Candidatus Woesearchaeota archaeon]